MFEESNIARFRTVSAGAFLSGIIALDLFLSLFCSGFPLIIYLVVGGLGFWFGGAFHERLSRPSRGAKFFRKLGVVLAVFSVAGVLLQFALPVNWSTKCSWRYCGRVMGPSLFESPFPVGTPSCSAWHKCANEHQFSGNEYSRLLQRMERQECAAP